MVRRKRGAGQGSGFGGHATVTKSPSETSGESSPEPTTIPLPVPPAEAHPETIQPPKIIPFWEKVANGPEAEGSDNKAGASGPLPAGDEPETPAKTVKNTTFAYETRASTSLQEIGQYALNASISSGRFEDLRVLAFSKRFRPERVGVPRAMYANSTLVTRAFPSLFQDERLDEVSDAGLALCDDISVSATYYGYSDDSDLDDDDQSEEPERPEDEAENITGDRKNKDETPGHTPPTPVATSPAEDLIPPPSTASSNAVDPSEPAAPSEAFSPGPESDEPMSAAGTANTEPDAALPAQMRNSTETPQKPKFKMPEVNARVALYSPPGLDGLRTIFAIDTAYRTWRAVVFYAYTRRVAFAPLRSQGLPSVSTDGEDDPSRLPICSPKSVYRLATKYGNAELEHLAGSDIASKLSTQNALPELFSHFTSRYPQIEDMELNFVIAHLTHPDIAAQLPTWIDRFARGELKECANTFGRLIHKLACAATAVTVGPAGVNACPRGCAMSPIQHRCTMCGLTFN